MCKIMEADAARARNKRVTFDIPSIPQYEDMANRVESFERKSWPQSVPQSPRKLAYAGFYYTGKTLVNCINL